MSVESTSQTPYAGDDVAAAVRRRTAAGRRGHERRRPAAGRQRSVALVFLAVGVAVLSACRQEQPGPPPPFKGPVELRDVTRETGISFVHSDGSGGRRFIIEPMCAGLCLFDYDDDGLIDIYFLNGAPLPGTKVDVAPTNRLYRNLGNWRFVDVTQQAGVGDTGFGLGVTVGDYDNDGDQDLFLNNSGPNVLYRNNGDGTFTDATTRAGIGNKELVGAGASFLDMDNDGDLDLYVANYLEFNVSEHVERSVNGFPSYPSPRDFQPVPDQLFENNGDGTFTDVSEAAGIAGVAGTGMGIISADCDDDGDVDVFVLNDVGVNFFFRNDGDGNFEEVALLVGLGYNGYGQENASMGVDCGDVNNDGLIDFFMTCYQTEFPVLYRNLGHGRFEDATQETHTGAGSFPHVNWGPALVDFDNDGDRDLFIANGHTEDNVDLYDSSTGYRVKNILLLNNGKGEFVDVSDQCGDALAPVRSSRGTAFDDLDNDGDIDGVVQNSRERPTVIRNDSENANHWIELRLKGTRANRDAVGARVKVTTADLTQIAEIHSGRGYQSHFGTRLHFGLGKRARVDRIEIRWPGGDRAAFENVAADRRYRIIQGAKEPIPAPADE